MAKTRQRIPKLRFTAWRHLGWHVAYRDRGTGIPRKHLFNIREREREPEARVLYHGWVLEQLGGNGVKAYPTKAKLPPKLARRSDMLSGCILEISTAFKEAERLRARQGDEPRRRGTITATVFRDRKKHLRDFMTFLNSRYGAGAVGKLRLTHRPRPGLAGQGAGVLFELRPVTSAAIHFELSP